MQAIDRYGNKYDKGETVQMKEWPVLYKSMIGKPVVIEDIKEYLHCESGYNVLLKDKESSKIFKNWLDTNWIQKLKQ